MNRFSLLFVLLFAPAAQAAPAYSEEVCVTRMAGERVSLFRSHAEANFIVQGKTEDFDVRAAYAKLKGGERPLGGEDLLLSITRQFDRQKVKFKDECYRGVKGSFQRELKVERINDQAREKLKLRKGQTLKAKCLWEALLPKDGCPPSPPEEPLAQETDG